MKLKWFLSALSLIVFVNMASAQFDDLYFVPGQKVSSFGSAGDSYADQPNTSYSSPSFDQNNLGDDSYSDYDDYHYSSRIRRFGRPSISFGYFSPVWGNSWRDPFWDPWYDPFWGGGNNVMLAFGNAGCNSWNRWNQWNNWGCGMGNWGWNNWGWNSWGWGNNYIVNNYYGWNHPWYGNHGGNNHQNNNHPYGTYYGSRKTGSSTASTKGRIDGPRKEGGSVNVSTEAQNNSETGQNTENISNRSDRQKNAEWGDKKESERTGIYNARGRDASGKRPGSGNATDKSYDASGSDRNAGRRTNSGSFDNNRSSRDSQPSRSFDSGSRNSSGSSRSSGGGASRSSSSRRGGG